MNDWMLIYTEKKKMNTLVHVLVHIFQASYIVHVHNAHSKNIPVSVTRKMVHWGQTPFRVNDDPEICQLDAKYDPELGQSDPIICQVEWFPGHRWPGMEFGPWTLFRVTADPGILECMALWLFHFWKEQ